jgi:alkylation response protein AidB-like acyl-CoA dehydrogenase
MNFNFTEDQLLLRDSVRNFLRAEVTPHRIRQRWESETRDDDGLWSQLAELGLLGMTVPEQYGGLGMSELDFVLPAEESGYVALPEPLVHNSLVAVPLLEDIGGDLAARWLPLVASGEARICVGLDSLVEDAERADLLLLREGTALYAVTPQDVHLRLNDSVDPSRKLFAVEFDAGALPPVCRDPAVLAGARDRGALGCAAQALGLARRMIDLSVAYTSERKQFEKPVGSFQAVKHHMADAALRLEYARAPVYRAAWSLANRHPDAGRHVSHAKLAACESGSLAAQHSIQAHGAMGYTWEVDLHIFMKMTWALAGAWGDTGYHKQRLAEALFTEGIAVGAGGTFCD